MKEESNILWINKYEGWTANKQQVYGIRGIGPTYASFWKQYKQYKPIWEDDDFPWSYVAFEDQEQFEKDWNQFISFQQREPDDPPYDAILDAPPKKEPSEEEKLLEEILRKELQAEINKEVINMICKNATK
jgi:hypothetical protein